MAEINLVTNHPSKFPTILSIAFFMHMHLPTGTGQDQPPKFPNIGYLGGSYNIFKGNPHSTEGLDPGFMGQALYEFTYDQGHTTPDGRYTIPDHTNVLQSFTCSFDFSSYSTRNTANYFQSLKVSVETSFSGWGASFSASTDYTKIQNSTSSSTSRYVSSDANCEAYQAVLEPGAKLSDGFRIAVKRLSNSNMNDYLNFIRAYGTHYLASVKMGGRYGFQSEFDTTKYMNMLSTGLDVSASAGYSGVVKVNTNASTNTQRKMAEEFDSYRESYRIYQVGGQPPTDPNGTATAWAQTVQNNPLPVHYRLVEIADLFTKEHFENETDIEIKQANLKNATIYYCGHILSLPFCNRTRPVTDPHIKIITSKDVQNIPNTDLYYQTVNNPNYAIMGMFLGRDNNIAGFYAQVDPRQSDPNLITTLDSWSYFRPPISIFPTIARPTCRKGFSSVSDFACLGPDKAPQCLGYLPKLLPCIANHCLTRCSDTPASTNPPAHYIGNGFKVFGNGNAESDLHFFRNTKYFKNTPSDYMCLNSVCVSDF